jgi:hypothetical protein
MKKQPIVLKLGCFGKIAKLLFSDLANAIL